MKIKGPFPVYVLIFGLFPVFAMLAANIQEMVPGMAVRSLLAAVGVSIVLLAILSFVCRDLRKGGLLSALLLVLFFSYGHVYEELQAAGNFLSALGRHRYLIPAYLGMLLLGVWVISRRIKKTRKITRLLNIIGMLMLVFPAVQIVRYTIDRIGSNQPSTSDVQTSILSVPDGELPPDVYYIILDSYTRADALKEVYGFDNSPFLDELKDMGFYVADCSQSNYAITLSCLGSTLNLDYLDALIPNLDPASVDVKPLWKLTRHSLVWDELKKIGYTRVAFETDFWWTSFDDADLYFSAADISYEMRFLNPFEVMLIRSTAAGIIVDAQMVMTRLKTDAASFAYGEHIYRERFKLEKLDEIARLPGPKMVFAHIIVPHNPFIFRPNGDIETDVRYYQRHSFPINQEFYVKGYVQQVQFINNRILQILKSILAESKTPPVIIIQGDHGVQGSRMLILNAYYLPEGRENLYPSISPVNSFRVVFNQYFGTDFPLLPDISYASNYEAPYDFWIHEEKNPACRQP